MVTVTMACSHEFLEIIVSDIKMIFLGQIYIMKNLHISVYHLHFKRNIVFEIKMIFHKPNLYYEAFAYVP